MARRTVTEIERAIRTSRRTLLVLSPAYLASQWTEFETLLLQTLDPPNQQRRLIPLLRERCDLPLRIRFLTYLNLSDPGSAQHAWPRLLQALVPADSPSRSAPAPTVTPVPITSPAPRDQRTILLSPPIPAMPPACASAWSFAKLTRSCGWGASASGCTCTCHSFRRGRPISQALLDYTPQLVHFSGHGDASGALLFENAVGASQAVAPTARAVLFAHFATQIECVLLNGCFTAAQATCCASTFAM